MAAYVLAEIEITNPEGYKAYTAVVPATIEQYGGKFLVRGGAAEVLEGDWPQRRRVIIEFPSKERRAEVVELARVREAHGAAPRQLQRAAAAARRHLIREAA